MDLEEEGWQVVAWNHVAWDQDQWLAPVKTEMKLRFLKMLRTF
jgi:hypothetical protein